MKGVDQFNGIQRLGSTQFTTFQLSDCRKKMRPQPGGKSVYYAFDSLNRLTNVTDWSGRKTTLTYDLANHLTSIIRPNGTARTMNYDSAGELTHIWEKTSGGSVICMFKQDWNAVARTDWEFVAPWPHSASVPVRNLTFDDDDRIATFNGNSLAYDLDGNMTTGPLTNDALISYTYDARNRLLGAGGINYGYDPASNRAVVTNGASVEQYVVNPNAKLSQILMRAKNGVTNYYVYGARLLYQVTETAAPTNTLAYHYDSRGSTVALTDGNGNVTDQIEYSAYATTTYRRGTNDTPFLYNGSYGVMTDANGLLYMRRSVF